MDVNMVIERRIGRMNKAKRALLTSIMDIGNVEITPEEITQRINQIQTYTSPVPVGRFSSPKVAQAYQTELQEAGFVVSLTLVRGK